MKNILHILLLTMIICCWSCGSGGEDVPTPTPTPKPEEEEEDQKPAATKGTYKTNAGVNMRSGAGTKYAVVKSLANDAFLTTFFPLQVIAVPFLAILVGRTQSHISIPARAASIK